MEGILRLPERQLDTAFKYGKSAVFDTATRRKPAPAKEVDTALFGLKSAVI